MLHHRCVIHLILKSVAILDYQNVINLDTVFYQEYFNLGIVYLNKGNLEKSFKNFSAYNNLQNDEADGFSGVGGIRGISSSRDDEFS